MMEKSQHLYACQTANTTSLQTFRLKKDNSSQWGPDIYIAQIILVFYFYREFLNWAEYWRVDVVFGGYTAIMLFGPTESLRLINTLHSRCYKRSDRSPQSKAIGQWFPDCASRIPKHTRPVYRGSVDIYIYIYIYLSLMVALKFTCF